MADCVEIADAAGAVLGVTLPIAASERSRSPLTPGGAFTGSFK